MGASQVRFVNYRNCTVWPEAWVAFAHRGKKVNVSYSRGTVRYDERNGDSHLHDPDLFSSRDLAIQHIEQLRASAAH